jgi:hypothetical protein
VTRFRNEGSTPAVLGLTVPVPNAKVSSHFLSSAANDKDILWLS